MLKKGAFGLIRGPKLLRVRGECKYLSELEVISHADDFQARTVSGGG